MGNRKGKKGGSKIVIIVVMLALLAGAGYVYTAPEFEKEAPVIQSEKDIFWNRIDPLNIPVSDNVSLSHYQISLGDGTKSVVVAEGDFKEGSKEKILLVNYPKNNIFDKKSNQLQAKVSVTDSSMWNFFRGNTAEKTIHIKVDHKRPNVNVLANSYSITQGGSALVVFQADDENLKTLYIEAGDQIFKAQPYKKEGYFAALIAWPFNKKEFNARIIAIDKANNKRTTDIPFYIKNKRYRVSWIKVKDKFIDGKITDLASSDPDYATISDKFDKLRAINETMRLKNEDQIHRLSKKVSTKVLDKWKINKFRPLKHGAKVANFGDERHYYYQTKAHEVSHSYHVGYDLASTKMASIRTSNDGTVVFAGENGIYGNMPMIDHGLGLYSLYGHCSQLLVKEGDKVKANQIIAKTGISGLALGDHLHFGLLVQGQEVRPIEWLDQSWIRKNIDKVFHDADKIILSQ